MRADPGLADGGVGVARDAARQDGEFVAPAMPRRIPATDCLGSRINGTRPRPLSVSALPYREHARSGVTAPLRLAS